MPNQVQRIISKFTRSFGLYTCLVVVFLLICIATASVVSSDYSLALDTPQTKPLAAPFNLEQSTFTQLNSTELIKVSQTIMPSPPLKAVEQSPRAFEWAPDIKRIRDRGELIVSVLGKDNPPFFSGNNESELVGLDIDIGKGIAEGLGVKVRFDRSAQTFNEAVERVEQKTADIAISKLSISLKRATKLRFSEPYINMRQGLLVNRLQLAQLTTDNRNPIDVIKNLDGKLGVIEGTQYALVFSKKLFPKAQVVEYPSWTDVVAAVGRGDVLAAFRDELEVKKVVLSQPDFALKVETVAFTDTNDLIAAMTHWEDKQLLAFINEYLTLNGVKYTVNDLVEKYPSAFGQQGKK